MSPNRVKTVSQLVEKYRRDYPELDRDLIRKLIRLENPELFSNSYANLKQLDRLLAKSFKQQARQKNESERTSFLKDLFDWIEQRAKRKEQERALARSKDFRQKLLVFGNPSGFIGGW